MPVQLAVMDRELIADLAVKRARLNAHAQDGMAMHEMRRHARCVLGKQ
jgi:hypothetical protein